MTSPREQNWKGAAFYPYDLPLQRLVEDCLHATNWSALRSYAASLNAGVACTLLPRITNGLNHLVCVLQFTEQTRWIVRIQMAASTPPLAAKLHSEAATMALLAERARVPVPRVFGYESDAANPVGVAFMLMEYLPGDVAMDADGGYDAHHGQIPLHRRARFYEATAEAQVAITSARLPQIGTVIRRREDGSYELGPIPNIGGPFDTATAFFRAWAAHARFPRTPAQIRASMGATGHTSVAAEVVASIAAFPARLHALAASLSARDAGPFPLAHADFGQSNIVIDTVYAILDVIDWEGATTVPWELLAFPHFLQAVPRAMDAAWNYDDAGVPVDADTRRTWRERGEYAEMVARCEAARGDDEGLLSKALRDQRGLALGYAVELFHEGKLGFYDRVLEPFELEGPGGRSEMARGGGWVDLFV